jgi:hypothetical protein
MDYMAIGLHLVTTLDRLVKVACVSITYNVESSAIQILHSMVTTGYQNPIEKKYLDQKSNKIEHPKGLTHQLHNSEIKLH